jgi:hypothetical protein
MAVPRGIARGAALAAPSQVLLFCHPEEAFRPTRDLLFDFFRSLFSRADRALVFMIEPALAGGTWQHRDKIER